MANIKSPTVQQTAFGVIAQAGSNYHCKLHNLTNPVNPGSVLNPPPQSEVGEFLSGSIRNTADQSYANFPGDFLQFAGFEKFDTEHWLEGQFITSVHSYVGYELA
jgi:hypothetical protein